MLIFREACPRKQVSYEKNPGFISSVSLRDPFAAAFVLRRFSRRDNLHLMGRENGFGAGNRRGAKGGPNPVATGSAK
jgi:hypothetical protein